MSEQGRKYDGGKLRYDLIPVLALEDMVKGLTFGTIKYDDNNWVKVPNGRKRYLAAALRHIQEYRKGNLWDEEQNIHHLSAAMNNLSFIVEKDLQGWEDSFDEQSEYTDGGSDTNGLWYPPVEDVRNHWIEWNEGKEPPLDPGQYVDVLLECERYEKRGPENSHATVREIAWRNNNNKFDIVAYRISK